MADPARQKVPSTPMGAKPRQRRSAETRRKIIDSAVKIFKEHGVENSRIEDIVAEADISRGTFFHYFPRKEDVLLALGAQQLSRMRASAARLAADKTTPTRDVIMAYFQAFTDTEAPPDVYSAVLQEAWRNRRRFEAMLGDGQPTFIDLLASALEEGIRRGEVRDDIAPQFLAVMLSSMVLSPLTSFQGLPLGSLEDMVRVYFDAAWDGFGTAQKGRKKKE